MIKNFDEFLLTVITALACGAIAIATAGTITWLVVIILRLMNVI